MGVLRELEHGPLNFLNKAVLKRTAKEFMDQVVAYNYMNFYPKGLENRPFGSRAYVNEGYYDGINLGGKKVAAMPVKGVRAFHAMDLKYKLEGLGTSHKVANDNLRDVLAGGHGGLNYGDYVRFLGILAFKVMDYAAEYPDSGYISFRDSRRKEEKARDLTEIVEERLRDAKVAEREGKGDGMISIKILDLGDKELNRSRQLLVKAAGYGVLPKDKGLFSSFDVLFMNFGP